MPDIWPLVHAERYALIRDLEILSPQQWEVESLCRGWSVHDVAAHLIDNAQATTARLLREMVRARFDFHRQNANGVAACKGSAPQETLARLRAVADNTSTPPAPLASRLVEEIAHGEDIRRPLGLTRAYPAEALLPAIRYQVNTSQAFDGAKELVAGVRLVALDLGLAIGRGPEVRGPALELLMLVSGRPWVGLSGPGVVQLGGR